MQSIDPFFAVHRSFRIHVTRLVCEDSLHWSGVAWVTDDRGGDAVREHKVCLSFGSNSEALASGMAVEQCRHWINAHL